MTFQRHIDYELYPPAATSHRKGWMITVNHELQKEIFDCRDDAERAAITLCAYNKSMEQKQ